MDDFAAQRQRLAQHVRASTGIDDARILDALRSVPRHEFVPESQHAVAYDDRALPIGEGQTISQPSMVALMLAALSPGPEDVALEVGAGSGYAAALLSKLVKRVVAVELRPELAAKARASLERAGVTGVTLLVGDGSKGLPEYGPYDVVLVSAAPRKLPAALADALAPGGRIALPVGDALSQRLYVGERRADGVQWRADVPCMFVPLSEFDGSA